MEYVRRVHPEAAARTATLRRLAGDLPATRGTLAERVGALGLDAVTLEPWEDVEDPAGGDELVFARCAAEIRALLEQLTPVLREHGRRRRR